MLFKFLIFIQYMGYDMLVFNLFRNLIGRFFKYQSMFTTEGERFLMHILRHRTSN